MAVTHHPAGKHCGRPVHRHGQLVIIARSATQPCAVTRTWGSRSGTAYAEVRRRDLAKTLRESPTCCANTSDSASPSPLSTHLTSSSATLQRPSGSRKVLIGAAQDRWPNPHGWNMSHSQQRAATCSRSQPVCASRSARRRCWGSADRTGNTTSMTTVITGFWGRSGRPWRGEHPGSPHQGRRAGDGPHQRTGARPSRLPIPDVRLASSASAPGGQRLVLPHTGPNTRREHAPPCYAVRVACRHGHSDPHLPG